MKGTKVLFPAGVSALGLLLLVLAGCDVTLSTSGSFTVTFDADGGIPITQKKTVTGGFVGSYNMPDEPARSGYVFGGWYTATNGRGAQFTAYTTVTADITVYAKWMDSGGFAVVTFNADGGTPATQTKVVERGGSAGYGNMPDEPTKSGYTFGGWYTSTNGGGTQFTYSTVVTADTTVYAKWTGSGSDSGISNITYTPISGSAWTLLSDGWRQSPLISGGRVIKERVSFTSVTANASITIQLDVSSEEGFDFAFISTLDNADATYVSGYYPGSRISGETWVTVTIPVPRAGSHFIEIIL
jgi:uncharacterized repeat protein (TIGR02543 family)